MVATAAPRDGPAAPVPSSAAGPAVAYGAAATELQPTPWCHTLLTALRQHEGDNRETGHLGILLSSLLELQLGPAAFAQRLARYAADPRPEIAAAASSLQHAWARAIQAAAPAPLPLPEQLGL